MRVPGGESFVPERGTTYWVDTTILPPGDPELQRQVVVLDVPETVNGTIVVVCRSSSRRLPVQGRLWTSATVTPV